MKSESFLVQFTLLVIWVIVVSACSGSKESERTDGIENIPIETRKGCTDVTSFIEKIAIVPLETKDTSLVDAYRKVMYDDELNIYAVYGRNQTVYTFTGGGNFVGSSQRVQGKGPGEYSMAVDMKFNPFLKGIDLLNPYGTVYTYTPDFELISERKIQPEFFVDALMALDRDEYIFSIPSIWVNQEVVFTNVETRQSYPAVYDGTISSGNTMDMDCFHKVGDNFYFVPKGINYYFYQIDKERKTLFPIIYLDFGDVEIKEGTLPGVATGERLAVAGTKPNEKRNRLVEGMRERSNYIRDNKLVAPLVKFFNDDYVYVYFVRGRTGLGGNYIYNRQTKKGFLLNTPEPFIMPPCFGICGNVLLAICDAHHIQEVVDVDLMSENERKKLAQLKEDDNPVIVKYYLKK